MPKHLERLTRARSRRVVLGAVAVVAVVTPAVVALGQAEARSGRTAGAADRTSRTRTYACAGTSASVLDVKRASATLGCAGGVSSVGRMQTAVTAPASTGSTASTASAELPDGVKPGNLLVTTVLTEAGSTVAMPGWARVYDTAGKAGLRLSAWYRTATSGDSSAQATVTPAAQVSMITAAFAGVRDKDPVDTSGTTASDGARWVSALAFRTRHDGGHTVVRDGSAVVVNGNTHLRQILTDQATKLSARLAKAAVSGALSVLPRPPAAIPAGAVAIRVGGRLRVDCGTGAALSYIAVSPTVIAVTCTGPEVTASPTVSPTLSPTVSPTTTSPSTTSTTTSSSSTTSTTSSTSPSSTSSTTTTTSPPSSTTPPPAPAGHTCTSPVWSTTNPTGMWPDGDYVVHNNMWNVGGYNVSEELEACSYSSWNVTATADNTRGDGAVKTYPNVHRDYHDWSNGHEPSWSSFASVHSTFAAQGPGTGIYNIAYDIWMNGVPGNREIMIWTENHNQQPAGDVVASAVQLSGITWDVWATSDNSYLAFVPRSALGSGSLDLKAMIDYLVGKGRVQANSTLGQVCFGVEVVSTDGKPATFHFTDFSVTSS